MREARKAIMELSRGPELRPLVSARGQQRTRILSEQDKSPSLIGSNIDSSNYQQEAEKNQLSAPMASQQHSTRAWAAGRLAKLKRSLASGFNLLLAVALLLAAVDGQGGDAASTSIAATTGDSQRETKAALESELNSLLQQHGDAQETNSKALSEAIISRLMLGNLSDSTSNSGGLDELPSELDGGAAPAAEQASSSGAAGELDQAAESSREPELSGPEAMRLRKMISYLRNFELSQSTSGLNNGQVFNQFPVLPASQAATIKRASLKMGNYLRQQQQQQHGAPRQISSYGRNTYDFGLGKRPDASVAGNILRFGDSSIPISGSFGKRPSAHRYDFGLGKRVASPAYPRYDFGLGKRAPNRIRYDFGLGKR